MFTLDRVLVRTLGLSFGIVLGGCTYGTGEPVGEEGSSDAGAAESHGASLAQESARDSQPGREQAALTARDDAASAESASEEGALGVTAQKVIIGGVFPGYGYGWATPGIYGYRSFYGGYPGVYGASLYGYPGAYPGFYGGFSRSIGWGNAWGCSAYGCF